MASSIWKNDGSDWTLAKSSDWLAEATLHDLVFKSPQVLPLSGSPRLTILGREVQSGSGRADLVAIEQTGRLVFLEVKLASNADARRAVVAQLLSYAAFWHGATVEQLERILASHLAKPGVKSIQDAVMASDQEGTILAEELREGLENSLQTGGFRLVFVLDSAPNDLVRLVAYLEAMSADSVTIDLITVSQYEVNGAHLIVPQRVDPERIPEGRSRTTASKAVTVEGAEDFVAAIEHADPAYQPLLKKLSDWALGLQDKKLANLYTSHGVGRKTLVPRVPGDAGLCTVWNDKGASVTLHRTVLERLAPNSLETIETLVDGPVGRGTQAKPLTDQLLASLSSAYVEAGGASLLGNAPHKGI